MGSHNREKGDPLIIACGEGKLTPDPFQRYRYFFYGMLCTLTFLVGGTLLHAYMKPTPSARKIAAIVARLGVNTLSIVPSGRPLRNPQLFSFCRDGRFAPEMAIPVPDPAELLLTPIEVRGRTRPCD